MNQGDFLPNCRVIPLIDPTTKEELKLNKEGLLENIRTKKTFAVSEGGFVVELTDPETKGKAHLEGNYLVSDTTNKRYKIDEKGNIQISEEEKLKQIKVNTNLEQLQKQFNQGQTVPDNNENNQYLEKMQEVLKKQKGVISEFVISLDEKSCHNEVISTISLNKRIVLSKKFVYNDNFFDQVLSKVIIEYSSVEEINNFLFEKQGTGYNCKLINKDGDILIIKNIEEKFLKDIKFIINTTTKNPNYHREENKNNQQENIIPLKKNNNSSFLINFVILILCVIITVFILIIFG